MRSPPSPAMPARASTPPWSETPRILPPGARSDAMRSARAGQARNSSTATAGLGEPQVRLSAAKQSPPWRAFRCRRIPISAQPRRQHFRGRDYSIPERAPMLDGVMLLWFVLTAAALLFVTIDIRTTPESAVLKWGFVLVTAYTGVIGAFLYVLGCREPLPGLHERYVAARWRQALESAMHCVAGDGIGILVGAVLASVFGLSGPAEIVLEYVLGFTFGWAIFQALFMRNMAGGSYARALATTFLPELLSMNLLMAGMIPTVMILKVRIASANHAATPGFWFVMSMGLLAGLVLAYPMNWWLVTN